MITSGIHLVHKPIGPTSFARMQAYVQDASTGERGKPLKVCHGGTLDPFASGLLLILVEPATRLFDHLHAVPKIYEATVRWGVETDNGDLLGQVMMEGNLSRLSVSYLDQVLSTFIGWHEQIPPATSAKRIGGERAYEKVHRGETVVMPASRVYLHEASWLSHDLPRESRLRLVVHGGYYVRALARDMGRLIGCGAHLTALHRTAIGPWNDPGPGSAVVSHGREIMPWARTRILSDQEVGDLRQGETIQLGPLISPDWLLPAGFPQPQSLIRGFHQDRFSFLLTIENGRLRTIVILPGGV